MLKVFGILALCLIQIAVAEPAKILSPLTINFNNDQQATITLSNTDINRIFVANDKITSVNAPNNRVVAHNDPSGSIYMNLLGEAPFTAFITTEIGRHFSLLIVPKSEPGVTIRFNPNTIAPVQSINTNPLAKHFELSNSYEKTVIDLLRNVMSDQIPAGYSPIASSAFDKIQTFQVPKYFNQNPDMPEKIVSGLLGGDLAIRVLDLQNDTKNPISLVASNFYSPGVRAVAIANEYLLPHQSTNVYEVVSNA